LKSPVDKISLEATLSNLTASSQNSQHKLDLASKEVTELLTQTSELRSQLEEAHRNKSDIEV
jgi:hypothetical protein